jgi:uroporphyrin-III C-methyltransferase
VSRPLQSGKVYLVGAGPGHPDLLTLKAAKVLALAEVVLFDALVSGPVLAMAHPEALLIDVGKRAGRKLLTQDEINRLLIHYARQGKIVIRLKGGDPLLFGRAGEEMEALRDARIEFEIIPGITAAVGAAAAARISLTDRRVASQVLFTTFSRESGENWLNWAAITPDTTIAIYMPGAHYSQVAARLVENGIAPGTPCVVVSNATRAEEQVRWLNLAALAEGERLPAPSLLLVGRVAAKKAEHWRESFRPEMFLRDAESKNLSI